MKIASLTVHAASGDEVRLTMRRHAETGAFMLREIAWPATGGSLSTDLTYATEDDLRGAFRLRTQQLVETYC